MTDMPHRQSSLVRPGALALLLVLSIGHAASAGDLRARLDRAQVYEGDNLTLTIEADGLNRRGQPELGALAADFDVLRTSLSSETRIINGQRSDATQWHILLAPKHTGEIQIPPIRIGEDHTEALTLRVDKVPQDARGGPGDDLYVEVEPGTGTDKIVVQQQVPLVVRLYSALPLVGGGLSEPRADGATLERLGEDTQYKTTRNGREYQVIERRYSLSPERSGELHIPPVVFEGEVQADPSGRGPFDDTDLDRLFQDPLLERMFDGGLLRRGFSMFERGKTVRAQSQALTLSVAASPKGFGGEHWLPAQALSIADSWSAGPPSLRVGEPVTRELTLTARGLSGTQIPRIEIPVPTGVRAYPEKTESESRTDGATLYGISRQRITLIPTARSEVVFPEIRVPWWDTGAQQERVAVVPAMTLPVEAAAGGAPSPQETPASSVAPTAPAPTTTAQSQEVSPGPGARTPASAGSAFGVEWQRWLALAAAGLLLAVAAGWLWWRRARGRAHADPAPGRTPVLRTSELRQRLQQACRADDPTAAAEALLDWARVAWPDDAPTNLGAIATRLGSSLESAGGQASTQIHALEQALYAPGGGDWQGETLWQAMKEGLGRAPEGDKIASPDLAPLYPTRSAASKA